MHIHVTVPATTLYQVMSYEFQLWIFLFSFIWSTRCSYFYFLCGFIISINLNQREILQVHNKIHILEMTKEFVSTFKESRDKAKNNSDTMKTIPYIYVSTTRSQMKRKDCTCTTFFNSINQ